MLPDDGKKRVLIESPSPAIDGGRHPVKRTLGDTVTVSADLVCDGHDLLAGVLLYRGPGASEWQRAELAPEPNDRWRASFTAATLGRWRYTLAAWVDTFGSWRRDLEKRRAAGEPLAIELAAGAELLRAVAARAGARDADPLRARAAELAGPGDAAARAVRALDPALHALARAHPDPAATTTHPELELVVDPVKARFSAWYELFPRSWGPPGRHGTLRDVTARLPYVASLGFDVLYLPPIHPIGRAFRKGKNNRATAEPGEPGSPWAIGASEGGHTALHPELGSLADLEALRAKAAERGITLALDLALQCSPEHPWVAQHPEWFAKRPDGSIRYAENPPKKYQDIYPLDFQCADWRGLWRAVLEVVQFWVDRGVRIFRADNPHTKPIRFWQWLIAETRAKNPEVFFLAEAFTRPKLMYALAKAGFSQSYTYFTWRNTRSELEGYFRELASVSDFLRGNLWPNTPDILPEALQNGGRPAFVQRAVLAATLGASWGIYGPAFELEEAAPREPGTEEYRDSEKYELRRWDLERKGPLHELIARLNRIRQDHPALQDDTSLRFHRCDNDRIVCYSKRAGDDVLVMIVLLDHHLHHTGWIDLDLDALGVQREQPYQMHDLFGGARYLWQGGRNFVDLDPRGVTAHILQVRQRVRSEHDFDYWD